MTGKLYIVPTPVGNMADMTPRAVEVLKAADIILAEDTRTSATLMQRFGIATPMMSHHKFNEHETLQPVMERLLAGETLALISDAGTPGISDPGFMLSRECRRLGIVVETLPGPTAFVPALVNSGLPCDRFVFEGFLPQKKGRASRLKILSEDDRTFILYESPLRLAKTLQQLIEVCGPEREAAVCREISKLHDTTHRGTLAQLLEYFSANETRGEIVIVVGGKPDQGPRKHKNKYKDVEDEPSND